MLQDKNEYYINDDKGVEFKFKIMGHYLHWESNRPLIYNTTSGDIQDFILPDLIRIDGMSDSKSAFIFNIYRFHHLESWDCRYELLYTDSEPIVQTINFPISILTDKHSLFNRGKVKLIHTLMTLSSRLLRRLYNNECVPIGDFKLITLFVTAQIYYKLIHNNVMCIEYSHYVPKYYDITMEVKRLSSLFYENIHNPIASSYDEYLMQGNYNCTIGFVDSTGEYIYIDHYVFLNKFYNPTSMDMPSIRELNKILYAIGVLIPEYPVSKTFTIGVHKQRFIRLSVKRLYTFNPNYIESFSRKIKKRLFDTFSNEFYLGDALVKLCYKERTRKVKYGEEGSILFGDTSLTSIRLYMNGFEKMFNNQYGDYYMNKLSCVRLAMYKNYIISTLTHELFHFHQYRYMNGNNRVVELAVQFRTHTFLSANIYTIMSFDPNLVSNIFIRKTFGWYGKINFDDLRKENPKISKISLETAYMYFIYSDTDMISMINSDARECLSCFRNYVRGFSIVIIEIDDMPFIVYDKVSKYAPFHLFIKFIQNNISFYVDFAKKNFRLRSMDKYEKSVLLLGDENLSKIVFKYKKK